MPLIHVIICFNLVVLFIYMDLVVAPGGIPGAFLNLTHYNACIFLVIRILHIYIYAFTLR